ncbi:hypothetical protein SDC9_162615 [bioreactor metagenome]|uniref:Uncharacterized protein n=1 Tax=bioreactor metagenome TaxID=1076179 RepID=A0A645FLK2_9ZZZZ
MQVPVDLQEIFQVVFQRSRPQVRRCFFKQVPDGRTELFEAQILLCFEIGFDREKHPEAQAAEDPQAQGGEPAYEAGAECRIVLAAEFHSRFSRT